MSLKYFHLLFIGISVFTTLLFGLWAVLADGLPSGFQSMGVASLIGAIGLLVYGICFFKKSKTIIT